MYTTGIIITNLITSTTSSDAISYGLKADGAITRFIYELPTGNYIALQFSNLNGGLGDYIPNLTNILNYTASSTSNPTIITPKLGILKLDGYNLTIGKVPFNESGAIQPHTNASAFSGYINLENQLTLMLPSVKVGIIHLFTI
jgi:hypothetical protein